MNSQHNSGSGGSGSSALSNGTHSLDEMFLCMWDASHGLHCNDFVHGYDLSAHLREVHGLNGSDKVRARCQWNSCNKEFNKESIPRHIEATHLRIVYTCAECGNTFTRRDTLSKHRRVHQQ